MNVIFFYKLDERLFYWYAKLVILKKQYYKSDLTLKT